MTLASTVSVANAKEDPAAIPPAALQEVDCSQIFDKAQNTQITCLTMVEAERSYNVPCMDIPLHLQLTGYVVTTQTGSPDQPGTFSITTQTIAVYGVSDDGQVFHVVESTTQTVNSMPPDNVVTTFLSIAGDGLMWVSYSADGLMANMVGDSAFTIEPYTGMPEPMCSHNP